MKWTTCDARSWRRADLSVGFRGHTYSYRRSLVLALTTLALLAGSASCSRREPQRPAPDGNDPIAEARRIASELLTRIDWKGVCAVADGCREVRIEPTVFRAVASGVSRDPALRWFTISNSDLPVSSEDLAMRATSGSFGLDSSFAMVYVAVRPREARDSGAVLAAVELRSPSYKYGFFVHAYGEMKGSSWTIARTIAFEH